MAATGDKAPTQRRQYLPLPLILTSVEPDAFALTFRGTLCPWFVLNPAEWATADRH